MAAKITQETISQVLAGMSPDELFRIANERRMDTIKDDIEKYLKTDTEQAERWRGFFSSSIHQ